MKMPGDRAAEGIPPPKTSYNGLYAGRDPDSYTSSSGTVYACYHGPSRRVSPRLSRNIRRREAHFCYAGNAHTIHRGVLVIHNECMTSSSVFWPHSIMLVNIIVSSLVQKVSRVDAVGLLRY